MPNSALCVGLLIALAASSAAAYPRGMWAAPGAGDHRSPCPGLNTLANHGLINRNGQNISYTQLLDAAFDGFALGKDVTALAILNAKIHDMLFPNGVLASLWQLNLTHNIIEHDSSLTRDDLYLGNNVELNPALLKSFIPDLSSTLTQKEIAAYRSIRINNSVAYNPSFTWKITNQQIVSATESAFITTIFGKWHLTTILDVEQSYLHEFFANERLPTDLGWQKRSVPILTPEFLAVSSYYLAKEADARGSPASIAEASQVVHAYAQEAIKAHQDAISH